MMTREQWLTESIMILVKEKFKPAGYKFNKIRVSVGFPYSGKKAIGEWWPPKTSTDNHASIFIHPGQGNPIDVLGVLVHELCHDACFHEDPRAGHGKVFRKCATMMGLEGKMRATVPSKELVKYLEGIVKRVGDFPHAALKPGATPPRKKQTTRMVKMECPSCAYICRAALTKIIENGPVICPCNHKPMSVEFPEDEE
jgi:hypothetical protein